MDLEKCCIDGIDFTLTPEQQEQVRKLYDDFRREINDVEIPDYGDGFGNIPNLFKPAEDRCRRRLRQIVGLPTD